MPRPLMPGDTVAIVSPASAVKKEYIDGACQRLEEAGYRPLVSAHAPCRLGSYSGSARERENDLLEAIHNPQVRAILCSRGGYGCVHLLDKLAATDLRKDPKWLIGFSDVSALHGAFASQGVASVHASMAKALALHPLDFAPNRSLLGILGGKRPENVEAPDHPFNKPGKARGRLLGGNLAVIQALIATPFNLLQPDTILYIEDIAEPIYKIERQLYQLRLSGLLDNLRGLVVGRFTEYSPDSNHSTMEEMIARTLGDVPYPVMFNAPIGHIDENMPVVNNMEVTLEVADGARIIF